MTLPDFIRLAAEHPTEVVFYFTLVPVAAFLAGWMEPEEDHLPPWNYLYSALLYLVAVPATLSLGLSAYQWSVGGAAAVAPDVVLQVVPVASFFYTAYVIHRRIALVTLPGFGRLAGLVGLVAVTALLLWAVDRSGLLDLGSWKVQYVVAVFLLLLVVVRALWRRTLG
ncbi:hypothetical protein GGR26_002539 [Lewinella marina]|uniref:Uncharacterized protein n=1 Tax=Neolewinella marina TaxID=438751 RepID=A0A2G0CCC1_9BACT|nr:hypothetical protein [Neolewinella marina]NJB86762.1 hypothetical protein [Neolewinella marina]PHK97567.1 hypothetical protein CGL56_15840 [Neolewinella marina]